MKMWKNYVSGSADSVENYLETYGRFSFDGYPFNEVDSLLLCQLAYLRYDGLVSGIKENGWSVTLEELKRDPRRERLFRDILFAEENRALFTRMADSRRFRQLKLNCFVNLIDQERETQFAAITFLLEDGKVYVAFRGTDETFVGWKEDFNMAFLYPVPGQLYAAKYLNMAAEKFPGAFYVGGHSKGGNFAIYSAMYCAATVRQRILKIYNMDGPGFRPEVLHSVRYKMIADKIERYLPYYSVIGMLFSADERYRVVQARGVGLIQHNPSHWRVRGGRFVTTDHVRKNVRQMDERLNEWIFAMDAGQRRRLVDNVYRIILAAQVKSLPAFVADWRQNVRRIWVAFLETDAGTKKLLRQNAGVLLGVVRKIDRMGAPVKSVWAGSSRSGCH
ncbi:MAG: DUF2974 domain-containing protein [Lachnospiraceae bacterium]|nr:DUF2974 domain-containing protein [Lachnospiraceae bacterium]